MPDHDTLLARWPETRAGWVKNSSNPLIGGELGTCFDISVLFEQNRYRMWFSWRPKASIAVVESPDGEHWSQPQIVLPPNPASKWEDGINRPCVIYHKSQYLMWYTGQDKKHSWIGMASSKDGIIWTRMSATPVVSPDYRWEKKSIMCPHVLWDEATNVFKMWYSGGNQYEPDAIGYATSTDGLHWSKNPKPVFQGDKKNVWECNRVTACQVIPDKSGYLMFYIGFSDIDHARIGIARSRDGITGWERFRENPIISPGKEKWDHDACYKPYAIFNGKRWLLWYNGRRASMEQIGMAYHEGEDLGL